MARAALVYEGGADVVCSARLGTATILWLIPSGMTNTNAAAAGHARVTWKSLWPDQNERVLRMNDP
jgi:hypothetical protein